MPEALALIRQDLGPEAVIVSNRKVRGAGWRGFFSPSLLEVTAAVDDAAAEPPPETTAREDRQGDLQRQVAEMKSMLLRVLEGPGAGGEAPPHIQRWREALLELEIRPELADKLLEGLETAAEGEEQFFELLTARVAALFPPPPAAPPARVYAFVGPTGVGKTTTLAKLAAQFALFYQRRVGLVTIDTYRIGAVDQLKTYGEIIGLPVDVVMTPAELRQTLARHADKDVVLIDTAGRPSTSVVGIAELRGFLEVARPAEVCLVLSCTTKDRDLLRITEDFRSLNYTQLIFTKLDETRSLGSILNVVRAAGVPVSYATNGQNVPDDIFAVDPQLLAKMILGAVV